MTANVNLKFNINLRVNGKGFVNFDLDIIVNSKVS